MEYNRRHFLKLGLSGLAGISAGNSLQHFDNTFILPSKNNINLRVAIASDGHFGQPDTKYEEHHDEMVSWLNNEHAERGIDFAFINGDILHDDPTFLLAAKNKWATLKAPFYVSHGNHDMTDEDTWIKTFNNPWHYGFDKNNIGFIVLNTADDKGTYSCPNIDKTKELLKHYEKSKQLFVFMHITPFKWTKAGIDCPEIISLFNGQSNLKAVFHGHDHDQDNVKVNEGKPYFFDSHIAGSWGTAYRGYRILEIMKNGAILTYQMNPQLPEKINNNRLY